jgi:hypothetical protein
LPSSRPAIPESDFRRGQNHVQSAAIPIVG